MVRFHTEEHHYDLAIAKLKELSEADKNIFKNILKIPPLPDWNLFIKWYYQMILWVFNAYFAVMLDRELLR